MVWTAELRKLILEEKSVANNYKPAVDIPPVNTRQILNYLFRPDLTLKLSNKPVWPGRRDFNPGKVTTEDMKYVEVIGYLNGKFKPEDFRHAPKDCIALENIANSDLVALTLKLSLEFGKAETDEAAHGKIAKTLEEVTKEISACSEAKSKLYVCELIPADAKDAGYMRILARPKELVSVSNTKKPYTLKMAKLLDKNACAVIDLPDYDAHNSWIPIEQFLA